MAYGWHPMLNYAPDEKLDKLVKDGMLEQGQADQIKQERSRLEVEEPENAMAMRHKIQQDDVRFDVDKIEGLDLSQRNAIAEQRLAPVVAKQQEELRAKAESDRQVEIAKVMDNKALSPEEKKAALAAKGLDVPVGQAQPPSGVTTFGPQTGVSGQPAGTPFPQAGFGRMRRDLRQAGGEYTRAMEGAADKRQEAAVKYGESMGELEKANQLRYEIERDFMDERRRDEERIAGEQAARRQRFEQERGKLREDLARAEDEARYFGMDYEQIQKNKTDLQSEDPKVRAQAQMNLQKAEQVDPNRLLGNAAAKIGAAIAQAMGAYAAAFTGRNDAMQIINAAIDRDIQAQRDKASLRKGAAGRAATALERNQQIFKDDLEASEATRLQMLRASNAKLDMIAKMGQQIENSQNYQKLKLGLANEINATEERLAQNRMDNVTKQVGAEAALAQAQMQERAAMAQAAAAGGGSRIEGMETTTGRPLSKAEVNLVNQGRVETKNALDAVRRLKAHVKKEGPTFWWTDADKRGKALAKDLQVTMKGEAGYQLGVLAGADMDILEAIIPSDPGDIRQDAVMQKLDDVENTLLSKWKNVGDQYGLRDREIGGAPQSAKALW